MTLVSEQENRTLTVDVGGSSIKAGILSSAGALTGETLRCPTPGFATPEVLIECLVELIAPLGAFNCVSIGFPGAIRYGKILTAPNLAPGKWSGIAFGEMVGARLGVPVRVANDATIQGLGTISGQGVEVILTLGTGLGFALFRNGVPAPQIELGRHPFGNFPSYDDYVGDAAMREIGAEAWKIRIHDVLERVRALVNQDRLYLGGGNARLFTPDELSLGVTLAPSMAGLTGGDKLWAPENAVVFV